MSPEGWSERRLGDVASVTSAPAKKSDGTRYVVVDMGSVSRDGSLLSHKMTDDGEDLLQIGDLVMPKDDIGGGQIIGKAVHIDALNRYVLGDHVYRLRLSEGYPSYVRYAINSYAVNSSLRSKVVGSAQLGLGRRAVLEQPILFPPLPEQRAIAEAISDADALVESLDALITKKLGMRQAAIQQLLTGRTRLPGFTDAWPEIPLGDIAKVKTGSRNNQDKVAGGRYPFFVRSAFVEAIESYSYEDEAILIPGEGGIGEIFHYVNGPHEVHQRVYRVSDFASSTCPRFVFFYLRTFFGMHALRNTVKATVDSLRLPTFLDFKLMLPPLREQEAIAKVLWDVDAEIDALVAQRGKVELVKQGMAQELLSGRVRLV